MAYTAPYIDDSGLHLPTYSDILEDLKDKYREIYGQDAYLEDDSQDGQLLSIFALKTYDTMQLLQIVYNNHSPKTAVGSGLSQLVKLNGIARKAASYSSCVLTLTGTAGTVIAKGVAEDEGGTLWDLPANITIPLSGEIEATAICEDIGAIEAPVGYINKISTPQKGWIAVTNEVPAVVGAPVETDAELRQRQSISTALPGQNMLDSTIAAIKAIEGVTRCRVYDNDTNVIDANGIPGHSIAAVVEGGTDAEVAEAIYLRKGPGGGTHGDMSATFVNGDGLPNVIRFYRPTYTSIDVNVEIRAGAGYSSEIAATIQANIEAYLESLDIGTDVAAIGILTAITAAVADPKNPSFYLASLTLGESGETPGTGNVPIAFNAVSQPGTVTVTEVT
jgi:uncharacterized phage protein gp47/JayE